MLRRSASLLFVALAACHVTSRAPRPSGPGTNGVAPVTSAGEPTPARSQIDGSCESNSDCEVAWVVTDCCGSLLAVGVHQGAREEAERAARTAHAEATCECLAEPPRLESGETVTESNQVTALCQARACVTRLAKRSSPAQPSSSTEPPAVPPVPCKSVQDCWVSGYPERPIARPKDVRHSFRGCVDGEVPPTCEHGVCALGLRYRC